MALLDATKVSRRKKTLSPEQISKLQKLAETLQGRPLPNVRVSEAQFVEKYFHPHLNVEWVDGEVAEQKQRRNPDVLFISKSRLADLHSTYFDGAPDLAMEIVSPDGVLRDLRDKFLAY